MQNFIYIPADGERPAKWLNLSLLLKIVEHPNGAITLWNQHEEEVGSFTGKQAEVLRRHLSGRSLSHRPEPELPHLPVLDAAQRLEARLERRGRLNEEVGA